MVMRHHLALAAHYADDARDPLLRARVWALQAMYLYSPLHNPQGDGRRALALLGRAGALSRNADGHTRAWLLASLAEEAADLGDVKLAEWALDAAAHALDTATGDAGGFFCPQGHYGPVAAYMQCIRARVAGAAGRLDEAERLLADQLTQAASDRKRINAQRSLGTVRVDCAEPEGASESLGEAVALVSATGYHGKLASIRAVRRRMDPAWGTLGCVRDLDERLHALA